MSALCKGFRSLRTLASRRSQFPNRFMRSANYCQENASQLPPAGSSDQTNDDNAKTLNSTSTQDTKYTPKAISIDRSGLYNPPEHEHKAGEESPMVKHLKSIIKFRGGPISIAEYMEEVLTNPKAGFYMNRDVFGREGDFITSPEISQMFGELIGVWCMCLWEQMGQPQSMSVIELGPGRGTLMADFLRGTAKFKEFSESISVHLVECSPTLRKLQYNNLQCTHNDSQNKNDSHAFSSLSGTQVSWHTDLLEVPEGVPSIIIAHEFYDALPVHQFQKTSHGWREKLIDIAYNSSDDFQFVLSREPTVATKLYLAKRLKWLSQEELSALSHIEVCPKAAELTENIARRIGSDGGAALIMDYGKNGAVSDSLQAIRKHKFVDVLDDPGTADLSAYVDFAYIRQVAEEANVEARAFGPITQSQFLGSLGINFRLEALLENATDEQAEALQLGYWRLVGDGPAPFWEGKDELAPVGMGTKYLALAITNKKVGAPVCFQ